MSTKPSIQPLDSDKHTKIDVYSLCVLVCCSKGLKRSLSLSMASLTVETALGSFDFLNSSDLEEEDEENKQKDGNGRSVPPEYSSNVVFFSILHVFFLFLTAAFHLNSCQQELHLANTSLPTSHLTTGCRSLDCVLVVHLKKCSSQLSVQFHFLTVFLPSMCHSFFL